MDGQTDGALSNNRDEEASLVGRDGARNARSYNLLLKEENEPMSVAPTRKNDLNMDLIMRPRRKSFLRGRFGVDSSVIATYTAGAMRSLTRERRIWRRTTKRSSSLTQDTSAGEHQRLAATEQGTLQARHQQPSLTQNHHKSDHTSPTTGYTIPQHQQAK